MSKGYVEFSLNNINDVMGTSWDDLDCVARNINDAIYEPQVFPVIGECIDGDFSIVGFSLD